jgi:hypothetical protein
MRQQNSFFLKRKMDAFFASILKKRWMPNLRQQLTRQSANQRPSSPWAYLTKQIYK